MEKFKKVAFTVYAVKDMKIAKEFYEKTLGFKPGDDFDGKWQEYDLGGTTFAISNTINDFVSPGSQKSVSFEVSDLKSLMAELKGKNVKFVMDEPMETPVCYMHFILDPDGNTVGLHQCK